MTRVSGISRVAAVRRATRRPFAALSLLVAMFALVSCDAFLDPLKARSGVDGSTGSLVISFGEPRASARTVTADFTGLVSSWTIDLSRTDGATRTVTASGATVTVTGLLPGSWNIAATGRNAAGATLFTGSLSGVAITASGSVPVTIPVAAASPDNGTLRLTVTVQYDTDIGSATATVDPGTAAPVTATVTVTVDDVAMTRTILIEASLPAGVHTLVYRLFCHDAAIITRAGTFVEAVNIYPGIVSDRWIAADGTLSTVRALDRGDLVSTNRRLSNILLDSTACFGSTTGFEPGTTDPLIQTVYTGTYPVHLSPVEDAPGQQLWYKTGPLEPWTTSILSGYPVTVNSAGTTIWFRVVSPNGDQNWENVYQIFVDDNFVRYHSNGPLALYLFQPLVTLPYTVITYAATGMAIETISGSPGIFICWNTASDGSGTPYPDGYAIPAVTQIDLYAQWQTPAATAALAAIQAQLEGGDGNISIPADFTANDLYALAELIAPPNAPPVTLDMSPAEGITRIPASVFNGCTALVAVQVSRFIEAIGSQAFAGTDMVTVGGEGFDFVCEAEIPPELGDDAFGPDPVNAFKVHVPADSIDAYKAADGWSDLDIHQIPP